MSFLAEAFKTSNFLKLLLSYWFSWFIFYQIEISLIKMTTANGTQSRSLSIDYSIASSHLILPTLKR